MTNDSFVTTAPHQFTKPPSSSTTPLTGNHDSARHTEERTITSDARINHSPPHYPNPGHTHSSNQGNGGTRAFVIPNSDSDTIQSHHEPWDKSIPTRDYTPRRLTAVLIDCLSALQSSLEDDLAPPGLGGQNYSPAPEKRPAKQPPSFYEPIWEFKGFQVVRRPDTPYLYAVWYDHESGLYTRRSLRTQSLEIAQTRLVDLVAEVENPTSRSRVFTPEQVQIEQAIAYYLERHMTIDNPSRAAADQNIAALREFFSLHGIKTVEQLDADLLDCYPEFRDGLYARNQTRRLLSFKKYQGHTAESLSHLIKPISDGTIRRDLTTLSAILNFYRKRNKITWVPHIEKPPASPARSRWLTHSEFAQLVNHAQTQRLRDYLMLSIHTLQRPGFLFDLSVTQVDLEQNRIDFLKPGRRQTKKGRPAIRISDPLIPILERLISESQSGYVLEYEGKPIQSLRKAFTSLVKSTGLNENANNGTGNIVPYTLRHTGATWLAQAGVDLWEIAGMMGHSNINMVSRVYAKHHPDYQQNATKALSRLAPHS